MLFVGVCNLSFAVAVCCLFVVLWRELVLFVVVLLALCVVVACCRVLYLLL